MRDLEIRGAGNLLGAEQHGHIADIGYDMYSAMLERAIKEEKALMNNENVDNLNEADFINNDDTTYTLIDQQYFSRITEDIVSFSNKGFNTSAKAIADASQTIWSSLQNESEITRNAILDAITANGIRTVEDAQAAIDAAVNSGLDENSEIFNHYS